LKGATLIIRNKPALEKMMHSWGPGHRSIQHCRVCWHWRREIHDPYPLLTTRFLQPRRRRKKPHSRFGELPCPISFQCDTGWTRIAGFIVPHT